jgi:RecG-like helicase
MISTLTAKQKNSLIKAGFNSIYSIITNFPFRYDQVRRVTSKALYHDGSYLLTGTISQVERRKNHFRISVTQINTNMVVSCYYFNRSRYVESSYKAGTMIQAIVVSKKQFLTIKRMVTLKSELDNSLLGKREDADFIQPIYSKVGVLNSTAWVSIHAAIPHQLYSLNLEGLVPNNSILPTEINLLEVHKPKDINKTSEITKQYNLLRLYLKLAQNIYYQRSQISKLARYSQSDSEYLTNLSNNLSFSLSNSQKLTIWSIITSFEKLDTERV